MIETDVSASGSNRTQRTAGHQSGPDMILRNVLIVYLRESGDGETIDLLIEDFIDNDKTEKPKSRNEIDRLVKGESGLSIKNFSWVLGNVLDIDFFYIKLIPNDSVLAIKKLPPREVLISANDMSFKNIPKRMGDIYALFKKASGMTIDELVRSYNMYAPVQKLPSGVKSIINKKAMTWKGLITAMFDTFGHIKIDTVFRIGEYEITVSVVKES